MIRCVTLRAVPHLSPSGGVALRISGVIMRPHLPRWWPAALALTVLVGVNVFVIVWFWPS